MAHETPESVDLEGRAGRATTFHDAPSQVSASGWSELAPTTMHQAAVGHDTLAKETFDDGATGWVLDQEEPSHRAAKGTLVATKQLPPNRLANMRT